VSSELIHRAYKRLGPTSQPQRFSVTKTNLLIMFASAIFFYCENYMTRTDRHTVLPEYRLFQC